MIWYKQENVKKIIQEVADELDTTPDIVLGVLRDVFGTIVKGTLNNKVKFFRIANLGSICLKGYIPKGSKSTKVKSTTVFDKEESEEDDYEEEEELETSDN